MRCVRSGGLQAAEIAGARKVFGLEAKAPVRRIGRWSLEVFSIGMKNTDAFAALAHPTRRRLLMELRAGARTASELAADMPISRPAVAEHLQILRDAGLVLIEKRGRERHYHLDPRPLTDVGSWLNVMLAFWARRLEDIEAFSTAEQ